MNSQFTEQMQTVKKQNNTFSLSDWQKLTIIIFSVIQQKKTVLGVVGSTFLMNSLEIRI